MKKLILITGGLVLLAPATFLWGIEKPDFDQAFANIYTNQVSQIDQEELYEYLWQLYQNPLNLNEATQEELEALCILSDSQINQIFSHCQQYGPLVSIYELQAIPEFDLPTIYRLIPFIQVPETEPKDNWKLGQGLKNNKQTGYYLNRYERILEDKQGYKLVPKNGNIPYVGSPDKLITRIKYQHPQGWSCGIAGIKSPGEAFTWDPSTSRYGFNVYTAYCLFQNQSFLKQFIIGDYQIGYGQGLIVNAGFSMNKNSEAIPIMRTNNLGIRPATSLASYRLRGAATTLTWQNLSQTIYYAYNQLDGRILENKSSSQLYVKSIQRNNLYNTKTALSKRGKITEQLIGTTLVYRSKYPGFEIGFNALYNGYSLPIQSDISKKTGHFTGRNHYNAGLFYRYLWHNLHFFGEGAISKSGGKAWLTGVVASLSAKMDASLLIRNFQPNFHSPYGKSFGENSTSNSNEQGLYLGCRLQPIRKINLFAYYDYFRFPAPTHSIAEPSAGYHWLTKATYQPNKHTIGFLQYQEKHKAKQVAQSKQGYPKGPKPLIKIDQKRNIKVQLKHAWSRLLDLTTEAQWSKHHFLHPSYWGYGLAQRVTYTTKKWGLTAQIAWFDTEADNKLYFYEKGLLYAGTMPTPYYHQGIKYALLGVYKPSASWRIEIKYAWMWLKDQASIGAGMEKIAGNIKDEIKLQILYQF